VADNITQFKVSDLEEMVERLISKHSVGESLYFTLFPETAPINPMYQIPAAKVYIGMRKNPLDSSSIVWYCMTLVVNVTEEVIDKTLPQAMEWLRNERAEFLREAAVNGHTNTDGIPRGILPRLPEGD
jgi:hypothetical protein